MIYPADISYMKTLPKKNIALPLGEPIGKGNLVFLFSKSLSASIDLMNSSTFGHRNRYFFYFVPGRYIGTIHMKKYRKYDLKNRLEIYTRVENETGLHPYKSSLIIRNTETRNMYYDLHEHLQIFDQMSNKFLPGVYIEEFWEYLKGIVVPQQGNFKNKYILFNVDQFPIVRGSLADRVKNPLFLLYYTMWKRPELLVDLNIDFLFYCKDRVLKVNPSMTEKTTWKLFFAQMKRLYAVATIPDMEDEKDVSLDSEPIENKEEPTTSPTEVNPFFKKVGLSTGANSLANDTGDEEELQDNEPSETEPDSKEDEQEKELLNDVYNKTISAEKSRHTERSEARDARLREEQEAVEVRNITINVMRNKTGKDIAIPETNLEPVLKTTNPNAKTIKFNKFNETYIKEMMDTDITNVFLDLNTKSIKMFVRKIDVVDSSDRLNYKETWTIHLEDENRQRHTIKVDIPKWLDNTFLWLGGDKKIIKNQNFFLPIVKIGPDTVLIVSNYNKMTINRIDTKSLRGVSILDKLLVKSDEFKSFFTVGNTFFENHGYKTTLEYDDLAKRFRYFRMKNIKMYFSQKEAMEVVKKRQIKLGENDIFIGFIGTSPIILDKDTQRTKDNLGITDIIFQNLDDSIDAIRRKITVPKRLTYTKVKTMKQDIPLGILACLWEGLTNVLKKAKIRYRLSDKLKDLQTTEDYICFANCYLIYDATIPNELLLNGLKLLETKAHDISYFDTKDGYAPFIQKKFGRATAVNMLFNEYEFMLGSIEREVLKDMGAPTDIVSLIIYANQLLCDNDYVNELDQSISRVRCAEIIPSILYDRIGKAYTTFRNSNGKKKLSIPQDAVIKDLLKLKTVSSYSSLNPFLELEETHGLSSKGFRGINLDDSYGVPKRCYDESMVGIVAPTSSPDGNCGVNRSLSMEPNITSVRGYPIIKKDNLDEVKDINLFSPAELMIPLGVTTDDSVRTGHSVKQSRHTVPVKKSSPVLISNGSDEICTHYLSSDFVVNAKMDGKVVEKDEKTKIMIVQYKDGSYQAVNLDKRIVKNGGGGFELSNQLVTDLEIGMSFKANQTLAWHGKFFTKSKDQGIRTCIGPMVKVAICGTYNTYEDSTFVTKKLSEECATEMCFKTPATIGRNANVTFIAKEGSTINAGDPLIQFDDSFEEADINKLLDTLGENEDLKDMVVSNNRNTIKSKYSGVIESITMYSTADLEDLSPSLQVIFGAYYKKIEAKEKLLSKYDKSDSVVKCGMLLSEPTGKIDSGRYGVIRGQKVNDGVLIEFEIKHEELLEVGSKIANFTALKNVVGEVLKEGYEPYSEFRPDEEIGTFIPPISILARMTPSIFLNALGNKCIIELKRSLEEIWKKNEAITTKRGKMTNLIYRFFTAFDKSGSNTKTYKQLFNPMSDVQFNAYFREFFQNEMHYLILNIVDYERTIKMEDIERAAAVLNIPLYEYVTIPHITDDTGNPTVTKERVAVGYINIKRTQQTVAKKNGLSTNIDKRSAITNQVVQADKNGRESDLENIMLTSLGLTNTLKELNGPRADDMVMKQEMLQSISTKGYVSLEDLTDRIENKTTLNTVDVYFMGMSLKTDLVTKGLKTMNTLKTE